MATNPPFDPEVIFSRLKGKVSDADLFQGTGESYPVDFKANRLHSSETNFSCAAGLRVVAEGRVGFASSNQPGEIDSLVRRALNSARFGEPAAFSLPAACSPSGKPDVFSPEVGSMSREAKIDLGRGTVDEILSAAPGVSVDLEVSTSRSEGWLHNTRGLSLEFKRTIYQFSMTLLKVEEKGLLWISDGNASTRRDDRRERQIRKSLQLLKLAETAVPTGSPTRIILEPGVVSLFVSAILSALNGKTVFKGISPLADKLGQRIVDGRMTLTEEPFLDHKTASSPFDSEGLEKVPRTLVDRGVPRFFIYDLQTAGQAKARATGHGNRSFGSLPHPGFSNLRIAAGEKSTGELIAETKDGLWVHSVLGGGQSNMLNGDFSLNAHLAYKIENGEVTGRVKDTMMSGNVYDVLNKVVDIGSDVDDTSSHLFPPLAVEGVKVSG